MMRYWQFHEAKNKFSEVIDQALKNGPQVITRRGIETAVVLSVTDYRKLLPPRNTISEFFRESPLADADLNLKRNSDLARELPDISGS